MEAVACGAAQLLDVWEQGAVLVPWQRALLLLGAAYPQVATLATWSLGRRDRALLELREALFGGAITAVAACPQCATLAELGFAGRDVYAPFATDSLPPLHTSDGSAAYTVELRPLCSADFAVGGGRDAMVLRCITAAQRNGEPLGSSDLPPAVLAQAAQSLLAGDPQADIRLLVRCEVCGERWDAPFDPVGFVWHELERWATRTIREVHLLALAYGWDEPTILALSAARRRTYLDMVTA